MTPLGTGRVMLQRSVGLLRRGGEAVRRIPGVETALQRPAYLRCRTRLRGRIQDGAVMLCVYRAANRESVRALVAQSEAAGIASHLWALDAEVGELARWTRGVGPGMRMELLNRLWEHGARSKLRQVVVCDDDFVFATGGVPELVLAAEYCDFGIAQAAHAGRSFVSHAFTRSQPLTVARLTSWVDVGPAFVVRHPWIERVLPFPSDYGMGWGLGLVWRELRNEGCRLGIVDAIGVRHLRPTSLEYDRGPEATRVQRLLQERGLQRTADAQSCLQRWMCWESAPKWRPA